MEAMPNPELPNGQPPLPPSLPRQTPSSRKWLYVALAVIGVLLVAAGAWWLGVHSYKKPASQAAVTGSSKSTATQPPAATVNGLSLDLAKNYGNKYSNGLLPVGDGKYATSSAKQGYIYACSSYAGSLSSGEGGAGTRGPWFTNNNTQYDINKKTRVQGSVNWQADFSVQVAGGTRTITTNDLPSHPTGIFPIASSDPAYAYDRNPNNIRGQTLTYNLTASPAYGSPQCMGGEVGVMLTGVALFNAFDAGGRDAGAWEVQDSCNGHPQKDGEYHYHTLSSCIKDASVQTVIGFALDGFPITGPKVGTNNILTTADLDECHGLSSEITLDGKKVTMYHYVMTEDFPYSASCFRATAANPPNQAGQTGQSGQQQSQPQGPPAYRP